MAASTPSTPQDLFRDSPEGLALCLAVQDFITGVVPAAARTTISQMAFRHRRAFAWVWNPRRHLRTAVPAVLSIALPRQLHSARVKEVVHSAPKAWLHHLELHGVDDLDDEIAGWIREAFDSAA